MGSRWRDGRSVLLVSAGGSDARTEASGFLHIIADTARARERIIIFPVPSRQHLGISRLFT